MIDTRFPTAFQMVLTVAVQQAAGMRSTSHELAASLGSNPSFVRKMVVPLSQDGILAPTMGKSGGIRLGRPAETITLYDIYKAVIAEKKIWAARHDVPNRCLVSSHIADLFECVASKAEVEVIEVLRKTTIADSIAELHELEGRKAASRGASLGAAVNAQQVLEQLYS